MSFTRECLGIVIRDLEFPLETEAEALTDGHELRGPNAAHDRGIDGISIALGGVGLTEQSDIEPILSNYDGHPRLLFVQVAGEDHLREADLDKLSRIANFLTTDIDEYLTPRTNQKIIQHCRVYHRLQAALLQTRAAWTPEIHVAVCFKGNGAGNQEVLLVARNGFLRTVLAQIPGARVLTHVYGRDQLDAARLRIGASAKTTLDGVSLLPFPPGTGATGHIGWVSALALVKAFAKPPGSSGTTAFVPDEQFFSANPRADLGSDEAVNPGGASLAAALSGDKGANVVLGHNGVVIVAEKVAVDGSKVTLTSPQIVNGRQSCHRLAENAAMLEGVHVPIKLIETVDADLRDDINLATNTQAPVDRYDLLALHPVVRQIERHLATAARQSEMLWFRRRQSGIIDPDDWELVITPRNLMEAFAAALLARPHAVHDKSTQFLKQVKDGVIFAPAHDPEVYRCLGWLIAAARMWARRRNRPWEGSGNVPQHQYVYALWCAASGSFDPVSADSLMLGRSAEKLFRPLVKKLADDATGPGVLAERAGTAILSAEAKGIQRGVEAFTKHVRTELSAHA